MRIIAISDTHMRHNQLKLDVWGRSSDTLIHSGDALLQGTAREFDAFFDWFKDQPFTHKIYVPGNHDFFVRDEELRVRDRFLEAGMIFLRDGGCQIIDPGEKAIHIWGTPWTPAFGRWAYMREEADLKERFALIPEDVDVLISHGPPYGLLDKVLDGTHVGSLELLKRVLRVTPQVHIFGHIHEQGWNDARLEMSEEGTNGGSKLVDMRFYNCAAVDLGLQFNSRLMHGKVIELEPR